MITNTSNIPSELKELKQWVCFGNDKVPKSAYTGNNAKSNDSSTWATFEEAVEAVHKYGLQGLGFMFANGYFGVDLDHVLDNADFVDEFVETLGSYTEISRSGSGIHIICKGSLPEGKKRKGNVEMYQSGRFFCLTGKLYDDKYKDIKDCTETIKILHSKYLPHDTPKIDCKKIEYVVMDDEEIIDKARNCKSGMLFGALYSGAWEGFYASQSEADLALCNQLAFWTQCDEEQMDRIFRTSGLYRKKWDEMRGGKSYGQMTIGRACASCKEVYEPNKYDDDKELALAIFGTKKDVVDCSKKVYDMTDSGNAERLKDRFGNIIRYSYNRKKWYFWDGKCWRIDDSGQIKKLADMVISEMKQEAFLIDDIEIQDKALKWVQRTASSKGKENMIKECQHLDGIPANPEDFDVYLDYLNCQNGVVNLRNGELLPHDPVLMMSKITNTEYDVDMREPTMWLKFLDDVTNGDKELQEYIQRCVGYSISGNNDEQCSYFLYGIGNNGKSTFLDTIASIIGGYASNIQPETIMMKRLGGEGANSDIARLKSARFVTSEEPTEGVRLNEGLLKQLTGGSKITCRFLYGDEFEYTPEFKIWMATNHKPVIRGTDFGIWRRIKLIPFEVTIPKEKIDKKLKYKLVQEYPQILAWAVQGCIKWRQFGLNEPKCVRLAVNEYKVEMDLLAGFMEQCIEVDYSCDDKVMASDLFKVYSKWAKENNEYEMNSKKFFSDISKKLPEKGRCSKGVFYTHIRFTDYVHEVLQRGIGKNYTIDDFK